MKYTGLIYNGQKYLAFEELEMPPCGDKDVILKNLVASICGSDTDTWLNGGELHYIPPHSEFGHEVVCEVCAVGKDVEGIQVGDRVAPFPMKVTPNPRKSGFLGGFSEYIYCTDAKYDYNLWKLDPRISNREAAILEPLAVSIHAADRVEVTEKTVILILGAGIIGFGIAARMVSRGVPRENITFVDRSAYRLELMKKQGFRVVNSSEQGWQGRVIECTGQAYCVYGLGSNADYIFDCAGSIDLLSIAPTLLEESMRLLKLGGTLVMVGVHRRRITLNAQKMVFGLQNMICGSGVGAEDFRIGMQLLAEKPVDFEAAITHSFPFSQAIEAIQFACETDKCLKVVIDYTM